MTNDPKYIEFALRRIVIFSPEYTHKQARSIACVFNGGSKIASAGFVAFGDGNHADLYHSRSETLGVSADRELGWRLTQRTQEWYGGHLTGSQTYLFLTNTLEIAKHLELPLTALPIKTLVDDCGNRMRVPIPDAPLEQIAKFVNLSGGQSQGVSIED